MMATAADEHAQPLWAGAAVMPVAVGVDGSPSSIEAFAWAASEAQRRGALLRVVSAWQPDRSRGSAGASDVAAVRDRRRVLGELIVETIGANPEIDVMVEVVRGSPAPVLLEAAEESALLVLGRRGRGGFPGMRLGSVGLHCVMHASCPVAIVQDPPRA